MSRTLLRLLAVCLLSPSLPAVILNWDLLPSPGFQSGSGQWGVTPNWSQDGTMPAFWIPGADAVFRGRRGGAFDAILVTRPIQVGDLIFGVDPATQGTGAWVLSGQAIGLARAARWEVGAGSRAELATTVEGVDGFSKLGDGELVLSGANTFTAGVDLAAGRLTLRSTEAAGEGAISLSGGTLDLQVPLAIYNPVRLVAAGCVVENDQTLADGGGRTVLLAGVVSGAGNLIKTGRGDLRLVQANTMTGDIIAKAGMVSFTYAGAAGSGTIRLTGGALGLVSNVTLPNAVELGAGMNPVYASLNVNQQPYNAALSGVVTGVGGLTKVGLGRMRLNALNTYAGGTVVQEGDLRVNGAIIGPVLVAGGTLSGNGRVGAVEVVAGGALAPGDGLGRMTAESLRLQVGGVLAWDLWRADLPGGLGYDCLEFDGLVDLALLDRTHQASLKLSGQLVNFDGRKDTRWTILRYGSLRLGSGSSLADAFAVDLSGLSDAQGQALTAAQFSLMDEVAAHQWLLVYTAAIPEPSAYGLGLGVLSLGLVVARRRRSRRIEKTDT